MANITPELNTSTITGTITTSDAITGFVSSPSSINGNTQIGSISDHRMLSGRDATNQHPEASIINLVSDLAARPSETIPNSVIELLD